MEELQSPSRFLQQSYMLTRSVRKSVTVALEHPFVPWSVPRRSPQTPGPRHRMLRPQTPSGVPFENRGERAGWVLERESGGGATAGWVSRAKSEFCGTLVITKSLSIETDAFALCMSLEVTGSRSLSLQVSPGCLPVTKSVTSTEVTCLGRARTGIWHLLMKILYRMEPGAQDAVFPSLAVLRGWGSVGVSP